MAMYVRKDKVSEVISPPSNSITPVTPAVTTTVQGGGGTAGAAGAGGGGAGSSGNEIQMPGTVIGETVGIEETVTLAAADHDGNMHMADDHGPTADYCDFVL
jgi:hypothetical protein